MKKLITTLLAAFAAMSAMADATVDGATYVDLTTDGAGTASSTNAEYYGYTMMGAFDNSWAGSANRALSPYSTTYPGMYVDYTFNTPTVVNAYSIRAADAGAGQPVLRAPNTWTLEGSDDGTTWTVLDSRSGVNNWTRGEVRLYEIANAHAYGHYRFSCTALNGRTDCLELHEIEFYFVSVPAVPATPDVTDGGATVSGNAATVTGSLADLGAGASSATVTIEYGTTDALGSSASVGTFTAPTNGFSATLSGLAYGTTYHYAFKAVNSESETGWSATNTFTTPVQFNPSLFRLKSEMTISGYAGSTTLANFPVLVRLAVDSPTGFDYNDCAADGSDIRFADAYGNLIPHEIDTWNISGESLIWLSVPSVSGTATAFTMYYGAADVSGLPGVTESDVWTGANFNAVWHFAGSDKESANGLTPSSSDSSSTAPSYTATTFGVGTCFKASNSTLGYLVSDTWTTLGSGGTLTLSTWSKFDGSSANYNRMLSCMSAWTKPAGWELTIQNASVDQITVGSSGQSQFQYTASGVGPGSGNVYLTVVYNAGGNTQLYTNGVLATAQSLNQVVKPTEKLYIGSLNKSGNRWNGSLDEIRIHRDAESADWVKACYDTMASASFLTMDDVTTPSGVTALTIRSNDATLSGTTATVTGRLAGLGSGATSAAVTLYYGTSANVESGTAVGPTNVTDKANLSNTLTGLTPGATYYYSYKAVNNAPTPETAWSATNSFVVEASTRFSDALAIAVQNCQMTVTGTMTDWGLGTTVVELLVGTAADALETVQTVNLAAAPANMEVAFDPITRSPGTYYIAIRATTIYGAIEWVRETAASSATLADTSTYTWTGGAGTWTDSTKWTTEDAGGAGYPTAGCTVVIPATDSDVVLSENLTLAGLTISSEGKHVFRTAGASKSYKLTVSSNNAKLTGAGGGTLVVDNIVIDSKVTDLAGLKQLAIAGSGRVFPANSETTEILLVGGGCVYAGWENKTFGKLILQGGPGRIDCGNYTFSFASLETRRGSGVSAAYVGNGKVSFRDPSGVEMVGGTDTLDNPGPQIPVCTQFLIASGSNDQRYGKSLCTIDAEGVVREIPQSSMLTSFDGATALDNVCIASDTTLDADVTVNAVLFSGANCDLGGHTVTVKSGQFREGSSGLFNKSVTNGKARLCKPNVVADTTNNADVRMRADFETEDAQDMLAPMLSHEAVNSGWAYKSKYVGFTGVFSTPRGQTYFLQSDFTAPKAVLELRNSRLGTTDHNRKANFGGLAGDGEINFNYNGANKWNNNIWLGEMSDDDMTLVTNGTVNCSVMVGNKGVFAPGLVGYDGGRRGSIRIPYMEHASNVLMLRAFLMQEGGTFQTSVNSDGTCGYLDASETKTDGKYLSISLAGTISVTMGGKVPLGVRYPVVKYQQGKLSGRFAHKTAGFKVEYDVPQPDGTYAVTVSKLASGTVITLR